MLGNQQSLRNRYLAKLGANFFSLTLTIVTIPLITRSLGPKKYGEFYFLYDFFYQLLPLFTFSTSIGFYTKLSQRQNDFGLISFYSRVILFACGIISVFILGSYLFNLNKDIWLDQSIFFVSAAAGIALVNWINEALFQVMDANGLTIKSEITKISVKVAGLLVIILLIFFFTLDYSTFYVYQYFVSALLASILIFQIRKEQIYNKDSWRMSRTDLTFYIREFYSYSKPLFIYSMISAIVVVFDKWLLQRYGGGLEQGLFTLSYQIGAVCLLFTSAMTSLITREFSIAHGENQNEELIRLFRRYIPVLYSFVSFISCFIAINSDIVISIFAGDNYQAAYGTMFLMAFYPIHQTYGQLSGALFYASGRTKLYGRIGIFFMLLGIPITYLTIAGTSDYGFELGSKGLAIKMLLIQFLAVNVQLYFNAKYLKFKFWKYLMQQIICVFVLLGCSGISKMLTHVIISNNTYEFLILSCRGILYILMLVILLIWAPRMFGLFPNDLNMIKMKVKSLFS
ncbi:MAG: lipopolysaccharide biosynthesis protein [Hydrotalea sp.]|nr:lipopolysaccharide biosynthesis protein [Hydrotalea sp.]